MNAHDVIEKSKTLAKQARLLKGLLKKRARAQKVVERFDTKIALVSSGQTQAPVRRVSRKK